MPAQALLQLAALHGQQRVGGVQHQQPAAVDQVRDAELGVGQAVEIVDAVLAKVIGADVGDDGDVGAVDRESAAQDAAARRLEHRRLDRGIAQHATGAGRAAVVARRHALAAMNTPSVQLKPSCQPCARAQAASRRTVVVLPFDPVTAAIGIVRSAGHGTASTDGKVSSVQVWLPAPAPSVSAVSSSMWHTPRDVAASISATTSGRRSRAARSVRRASAAASSSTGGRTSAGSCASTR